MQLSIKLNFHKAVLKIAHAQRHPENMIYDCRREIGCLLFVSLTSSDVIFWLIEADGDLTS
jgi:hypothetical protein